MLVDAKRHGRVRADITGADVTIGLWAIRGIIETTGGRAPEAWQRHLDVYATPAGLRPAADPRPDRVQSREKLGELITERLTSAEAKPAPEDTAQRPANVGLGGTNEIMQRRALGRQGLAVSALGLGTMGMTMAYGRPTSRGSRRSGAPTTWASRSSTPPNCTGAFLRQREARRRSGSAVPRRGRDRYQVRLRPDRYPASGTDRRGPSTSSRSPTTACATSAPTTSICSTSTASIPRCRSRTSRAPLKQLIDAGKVRYFGLSRRARRRSAAPTPCSRSPRSRPSTRSSSATSREGAARGA